MKHKSLWLCLALLSLSLPATADDSVIEVYALQQSAGVQPKFDNADNVLLGVGTPLLAPTLFNQGYGFANGVVWLAFASSIVPLDGRLELTLTIAGVTYTTGCWVNYAHFGIVTSSVNSFLLPLGFYSSTPATLTVAFNGQIKSYTFNFQEP